MSADRLDAEEGISGLKDHSVTEAGLSEKVSADDGHEPEHDPKQELERIAACVRGE